MSDHGRIIGGCCGGFPEPEAKDKKEEKGCCHGGCVQCNRETGCGLGSVQEGSVQDASGSGLLQKEKKFPKAEFLIITNDSEYLFDLNDVHHDMQAFAKWVTGWGHEIEVKHVIIFALKRNELSYRYHELKLDTIKKIVGWNLDRWKAEPLEGVV